MLFCTFSFSQKVFTTQETKEHPAFCGWAWEVWWFSESTFQEKTGWGICVSNFGKQQGAFLIWTLKQWLKERQEEKRRVYFSEKEIEWFRRNRRLERCGLVAIYLFENKAFVPCSCESPDTTFFLYIINYTDYINGIANYFFNFLSFLGSLLCVGFWRHAEECELKWPFCNDRGQHWTSSRKSHRK